MAEAATIERPEDEPRPGDNVSWAKGEPVPKDMPMADADVAPLAARRATVDPTPALAKLQREKIDATEQLYGDVTQTLDADAAIARKAFEQSGAALDDPALKPWDEAEQQKKFETDPIQAFGSIGSIFGILASSFTNAPLTNSLNASAAAINAIKAGDRRAYEDSRKAWENNYKLAISRQKMQHAHYQDAISLMNTDMAAGEAKLRVQAARFGDKQTLALLDAGLSKDAIDLQAARQRILDRAVLNEPKIVQANMEMEYILRGTEKYMQQGMNRRDAKLKAYQDWQLEQAKVKAAARPSLYGGAADLTIDRQIAQAVAKKREELRADHPDWSETQVFEKSMEYGRELKQTATPITANRGDEIKESIHRIETAENIIGKIEDLLKKHNAISGFGGTITRGFETTAQVFGSNETDRGEFARLVETLKLLAPRVLLDSRGRPLGTETDRVDKIIAGTNFGDLKPATLRAYKELRDILRLQRRQFRERLGALDKDAKPPAPAPSDKWWEAAPPAR